MNGKPGVLAVMDRAVIKLDLGGIEAMNLSLAVAEARATVERLADAAEAAEAFIGVMFGGRVPETVNTPLGVPVKVGAIARRLAADLAAFRGEGA